MRVLIEFYIDRVFNLTGTNFEGVWRGGNSGPPDYVYPKFGSPILPMGLESSFECHDEQIVVVGKLME